MVSYAKLHFFDDKIQQKPHFFEDKNGQKPHFFEDKPRFGVHLRKFFHDFLKVKQSFCYMYKSIFITFVKYIKG